MSVRIAPTRQGGYVSSSARFGSPAPCLRPVVPGRHLPRRAVEGSGPGSHNAVPSLLRRDGGRTETRRGGGRSGHTCGRGQVGVEPRRSGESPQRRRTNRDAWRRPSRPRPAYREIHGRPGCAPARRRLRRTEGREDTLVLRLLFAAVIAAMCAVPLWGLVFSPSPQGAGGGAPASVGVVTVNEGESLSDVARRVAPAVPIDVAVANIRELNGLQNSLVVPGQSLVAPVVPCTGDCSLGPWQ